MSQNRGPVQVPGLNPGIASRLSAKRDGKAAQSFARTTLGERWRRRLSRGRRVRCGGSTAAQRGTRAPLSDLLALALADTTDDAAALAWLRRSIAMGYVRAGPRVDEVA